VETRLANLPPCLIGMEACVGAHHLSRKLRMLGHDARLMPAKYVRAIAPDRVLDEPGKVRRERRIEGAGIDPFGVLLLVPGRCCGYSAGSSTTRPQLVPPYDLVPPILLQLAPEKANVRSYGADFWRSLRLLR
jgi:hypothetical protein